MALNGLRKFNQVYPLLVNKFQEFLPANESADPISRINDLVLYLNKVGKLTNDVVADWNKVMTWVLNEGIETTVNDKVNELVENGTLDNLINPIIDKINELAQEQIDLINNNQVAKKSEVEKIISNLNDIVINVKDYGALGDCVLDSNGKFLSGTNNTTFILNAINATPLGGTLLFPYGKYYFHYIELVRSDITIISDNASLISSVQPEEGKHAIRFIGSNITIRDIDIRYDRPFDYDTTYKPTAFGASNTIRLGGEHPDKQNGGFQKNILVERVTVNGGYSGGIDLYFAEDIRVTDCRVTNTLGNGINFASCIRDIIVENNIVMNTRDDGIQNVTDMQLNNPFLTINYVCRNNRVINGYAKGISTTGVDGAIISDNYVENTYGGGIQPFYDSYYKLGTSKKVSVLNNTIVKAGYNFGTGKYKTAISANADGVYISAETEDIIIENNKIYDSKRHGISVINGAKDIKILNNIIKTTGARGIHIGDTENGLYTSGYDIDIIGNTIKNVVESPINYGGVSSGVIERNKLVDWGNSNYPIYIKNSRNVVVNNNVMNNETKGLVSNLVRIEGVSPSVVDSNNRLLNNSSDQPRNSILIGTQKLVSYAGKPTTNIWVTRDSTLDTNATTGGKIGYWCSRGGRAAPTWVANTVYTLGQYIVPTSDNGYAFKCITAGTSGATTPTWVTTTSDSQTTDGTVVWQRAETSALFKQYGVIDA